MTADEKRQTVMTADTKVYVSLTTIPARVPGIEACIRSLHEQSIRPKAIFLCIPRHYRSHGEAVDVPDSLLEKYPLLKIVRCAEDFGPGTKILGSLDLVGRDPNTLVVLVDDDSTYENYMLEEFVRAFRADQHRAYSFFVFRYRGIQVGQGCDGLAIPAALLGGLRSYFEKIRGNDHAFFVDDLWLSHYLQRIGAPVASLRKRIRGGRFFKGTIYHIYNEADALRSLKGKFRRWTCMAETRKLLRREFGL